MNTTPCPTPAHQRQGVSLAAPAVAGQGSGSRTSHAWQSIGNLLNGQSGAGMLSFGAQASASAAAPGKRSAGAAAGAEPSPLPDGNHGENLSGDVA